jgi:hypothetical protein
LPQWRLVAGCLYQTVWNVLTGRPRGTGIRDYDLIYFDEDLSWAAEDAVIRRAVATARGCVGPVETRNQARVHLWFEFACSARAQAPRRASSYLPFAPVSTRTPKRARSIASWVKACTARIALPALEPSGRLRQERRRPPPRALSTGRTTVSSSSKLFAALKDGRLGGAALDVWWQYPTPDEPERRPSRRPFHELSNVLITPHSSSSSAATADRRWSAVAANLDRYARGENLENIVLQT